MIGDNVFDRVLRNARLKLSDQERTEFLKDLENILEAFAIMDRANVDDLEPAFHPFVDVEKNRHLSLRSKDVPTQFANIEDLKNSLNLNSDGYMWGPRIKKK